MAAATVPKDEKSVDLPNKCEFKTTLCHPAFEAPWSIFLAKEGDVVYLEFEGWRPRGYQLANVLDSKKVDDFGVPCASPEGSKPRPLDKKIGRFKIAFGDKIPAKFRPQVTFETRCNVEITGTLLSSGRPYSYVNRDTAVLVVAPSGDVYIMLDEYAMNNPAARQTYIDTDVHIHTFDAGRATYRAHE